MSTTTLRSTKYKMKTKANVVWTREKITKLIGLYQAHECLWNNYIESYKNKEKRTNAIEMICSSMGIGKIDFVKKIHNLRNQFNAEMKKLEKKMETSKSSTLCRSRWEHYESLRFLKEVIAPRPGYSSLFKGNRKIDKKYDLDSDNDNVETVVETIEDVHDASGDDDCTDVETEIQFKNSVTLPAETANHSTACLNDLEVNYENIAIASREEVLDQKYNRPSSESGITHQVTDDNKPQPPQPLYITRLQSQPSIQQEQQKEIIHLDGSNHHHHTHNVPTASIVEVASPQAVSVEQYPRKKFKFQSSVIEHYRDQYDAFGEMVAAEFRNLNSDLSRKKLKRKIMQAMLEVGLEDDGININISLN